MDRVTDSGRQLLALLEQQRLAWWLFQEHAVPSCFVDENGRVIVANAAMQNLLGWNGSQFQGMHFADFTVGTYTPSDVAEFERLVRGEIDTYPMDKRYRTARGLQIPARLFVKRCRLDGIDGVVVFSVIKPSDPIADPTGIPDDERQRILNEAIGRAILRNPRAWLAVVGALLAALGVKSLAELFLNLGA